MQENLEDKFELEVKTSQFPSIRVIRVEDITNLDTLNHD